MAKKKTQTEKKKKFHFFTKGSVDYMILVAFGLIMVLSASAPSSLSETDGKSSYQYIKQQAISAVIGLVAMMACSKVDYHIFRKLKWIIYIVFIILLYSLYHISKKFEKYNRICNK